MCRVQRPESIVRYVDSRRLHEVKDGRMPVRSSAHCLLPVAAIPCRRNQDSPVPDTRGRFSRVNAQAKRIRVAAKKSRAHSNPVPMFSSYEASQQLQLLCAEQVLYCTGLGRSCDISLSDHSGRHGVSSAKCYPV